MESMHTYAYYDELIKPFFAPPAWVFGPVWTFLYIIIAVSFGYVAYLFFTRKIPFWVMFPFFLNLIFNFAFTPIQFWMRNNLLATVDILLTVGTLIRALIAIYPYRSWITLVNIPYLLWGLFATTLQISITYLNWWGL